jgi:hypothetical protein
MMVTTTRWSMAGYASARKFLSVWPKVQIGMGVVLVLHLLAAR